MRILFLTDTHWTQHPAGPPGHAGVWQKELFDTHADRMPSAFLKAVAHEQPDLIIHGGDLCREPGNDDWTFARQVMDDTGVPWRVVPGNHDTSQRSHRDEFGRIFDLEPGKLFRAERIDRLGFIFLDSTFLWRKDKIALTEPTDTDYEGTNVAGIGIDPDQLVFLEKQLKTWHDLPTVIVTHCALVGKAGYPVHYRKEKPIEVSLPHAVAPWMIDIHGCWVMPLEQRRAEMLHLCRQFGRVKLVLSGHAHLASACCLDGVTHCICSPMSAWPLEMRMMQITDDHIRVDPVALGDEQLVRAAYRADWNNDWVRGMTDHDRHIVIELTRHDP